MDKKVAIIILTWDGIENTKHCLESLLRIQDVQYSIIVIDNGSRENEADQLKRIYGEKITTYRLSENTGFTGGCNYGIMQAKEYNPDFYLLLNNDTQVTKHFLSTLITTASSDKKIGVLSPAIYDFHKKNVTFSGGAINWLLGKTYHKKETRTTPQTYSFITGCCLMIRKEVIETVGLLDPQFFAYFEDAAYCLSVQKAGYRCICEPRAIIFHQETASSDKKGAFHTYLMARNRILFVNSYAPQVITYYFLLFNAMKLIWALIFFILTRQNHRAYAYAKGYVDGMLGKGGPPTL